ncbi:hypothetical protein CBM2617_B180179 [Cupriavidus taiwanensis]|nr:hypothetical protein CBM2617_B180179 [Cupriavidus taiwanensis]SOZ87144.1 hypothetical protein CBM2618_B200176 [Cupriavidus taiwanensis]SOZ90145.1 hypothetical protein CBM2622_B190178 [Cupriavidus taiwanensis]SOZ94736.1 hypothetical protein CBM2621_B190181 [Cupriavidus taiwanensis]
MEKIRVIVADSQPVMRRLLGRRLAASACIELAALVADERGLALALGQGVCDVVALRFPLGNGTDEVLAATRAWARGWRRWDGNAWSPSPTSRTAPACCN